jgi:hypothetical protein
MIEGFLLGLLEIDAPEVSKQYDVFRPAYEPIPNQYWNDTKKVYECPTCKNEFTKEKTIIAKEGEIMSNKCWNCNAQLLFPGWERRQQMRKQNNSFGNGGVASGTTGGYQQVHPSSMPTTPESAGQQPNSDNGNGLKGGL